MVLDKRPLPGRLIGDDDDALPRRTRCFGALTEWFISFITMAKQRTDYTAIDTAVALRADLIRVARRTAELIDTIAATYTKAAATYRHMAHQRGPDGLRYRQHAARLDHRAARARRFAQQEHHVGDQGASPNLARPTGETGRQVPARTAHLRAL